MTHKEQKEMGGVKTSSVIMSKYRVLAKKGEGTFSEVLRVSDLHAGHEYAVKCMKSLFPSMKQVNELREIQALRRLNPHPNIISMHEILYDPHTGRLAIVMELMQQNIYELIRHRREPLGAELVRSLMFQLLTALCHMHDHGVFHRDIKPENVLVMDSKLKVADLGSCRGLFSQPPYTEYISTRWYRAPECLLTNGFYDYKMDLWGVGCVFFELATLHPLFPGHNELDQIDKIHQILGTPHKSILASMQQRSSHVNASHFAVRKGTGFAHLLPPSLSCPEMIDLIDKLLIYNPEKRITARQALQHAYFEPCRQAMSKVQMPNTLASSSSSSSPHPPASIAKVALSSSPSTHHEAEEKQQSEQNSIRKVSIEPLNDNKNNSAIVIQPTAHEEKSAHAVLTAQKKLDSMRQPINESEEYPPDHEPISMSSTPDTKVVATAAQGKSQVSDKFRSNLLVTAKDHSPYAPVAGEMPHAEPSIEHHRTKKQPHQSSVALTKSIATFSNPVVQQQQQQHVSDAVIAHKQQVQDAVQKMHALTLQAQSINNNISVISDASVHEHNEALKSSTLNKTHHYSSKKKKEQFRHTTQVSDTNQLPAISAAAIANSHNVASVLARDRKPPTYLQPSAATAMMLASQVHPHPLPTKDVLLGTSQSSHLRHHQTSSSHNDATATALPVLLAPITTSNESTQSSHHSGAISHSQWAQNKKRQKEKERDAQALASIAAPSFIISTSSLSRPPHASSMHQFQSQIQALESGASRAFASSDSHPHGRKAPPVANSVARPSPFLSKLIASSAASDNVFQRKYA